MLNLSRQDLQVNILFVHMLLLPNSRGLKPQRSCLQASYLYYGTTRFLFFNTCNGHINYFGMCNDVFFCQECVMLGFFQATIKI